jgi:hypothetical protein
VNTSTEDGGPQGNVSCYRGQRACRNKPSRQNMGVGFGEENAEENRDKWGLNLLRKALTKARQQIKEEESKL